MLWIFQNSTIIFSYDSNQDALEHIFPIVTSLQVLAELEQEQVLELNIANQVIKFALHGEYQIVMSGTLAQNETLGRRACKVFFDLVGILIMHVSKICLSKHMHKVPKGFGNLLVATSGCLFAIEELVGCASSRVG